jgi:hypothetical protein
MIRTLPGCAHMGIIRGCWAGSGPCRAVSEQSPQPGAAECRFGRGTRGHAGHPELCRQADPLTAVLTAPGR